MSRPKIRTVPVPSWYRPPIRDVILEDGRGYGRGVPDDVPDGTVLRGPHGLRVRVSDWIVRFGGGAGQFSFAYEVVSGKVPEDGRTYLCPPREE